MMIIKYHLFFKVSIEVNFGSIAFILYYLIIINFIKIDFTQLL